MDLKTFQHVKHIFLCVIFLFSYECKADLQDNWLIVLGSYPRSSQQDAISRLSEIKQLGIAARIIQSDQYSNLSQGLNIVVIGPYQKTVAINKLSDLKKIVGDAYIKSAGNQLDLNTSTKHLKEKDDNNIIENSINEVHTSNKINMSDDEIIDYLENSYLENRVIVRGINMSIKLKINGNKLYCREISVGSVVPDETYIFDLGKQFSWNIEPTGEGYRAKIKCNSPCVEYSDGEVNPTGYLFDVRDEKSLNRMMRAYVYLASKHQKNRKADPFE